MRRILTALALAVTTTNAGYDAAGVAGRWVIDAYKVILSSRQPASTCNFHPTCSQFTRRAIESKGLAAGIIVGADRLTRCNPHAWTQLGLAYVGTTDGRLNDPVSSPGSVSLAIASSALLRTEVTVERDSGPAELDFARWLAKRGDWYRAGAEYVRAAALSPDSTIRVEATLLSAEALLRSGRHELAQSLFADALPHAPATARLGIARTLFAAGRYKDCRIELAELAPSLAREKTLLSGWALFREHRFADAASVFRDADEPEWLALAVLDGRDLPRRSRLLAATLSAVVPGAGQVYAGRVPDGIYSLLAVTGSGFLTWWFASEPERRDRTHIKTTFFGATTALFYAGGVYGANRAAGAFNRWQEERYAALANDLLDRMRLDPGSLLDDR